MLELLCSLFSMSPVAFNLGICHQDIRILFSHWVQILTLDVSSKSLIEEMSFLFSTSMIKLGTNIIFSFCWKIIKAFWKDVWLLQIFELKIFDPESREMIAVRFPPKLWILKNVSLSHQKYTFLDQIYYTWRTEASLK